METLTTLQQAVLQVLALPATAAYPMPNVRETLIRDDEHGRFLVVRNGWHQGTDYYAVIQDVEVRDGQIIINQNNTEHDLAEELYAAGVAPGCVVLATVAPEQRLAS